METQEQSIWSGDALFENQIQDGKSLICFIFVAQKWLNFQMIFLIMDHSEY